jgi:hypothetical protein
MNRTWIASPCRCSRSLEPDAVPRRAGRGSVLTASVDTPARVIYAPPFFDLQFDFAETVSAVSGLPLTRTLLEYTNLYIRFGLGRDFDPTHPRWREYLDGLLDAKAPREWTFRFYVRRPDTMAAPAVVATFGCFSYARLSGDRIRLHFQNAETDGHSPLAMERRDRRFADLAGLFAHVKRGGRQPLRVIGASWLYNLGAYRRLFPESYLATAHVIHGRFRHMPLWGQFVTRYGEVRESMARPFREHLRRQCCLEGLDRCFPLPVLALEAPVREFYEFYGV